MTQRVITVSILLVALVAIWQIWPSDERRIRRIVHELAAAVEPGAGESDLARAARLAPLSRHLASDVVVDGPAPLQGRDQVLGAALQMSRAAAGVSLRVHGVAVAVEPSRDTAVTTLGVTVTGGDAGRGETWRDLAELRLELARRDDVWQVTRVAPVTALAR